jgi:prepilin-type processing-associated H-X9-DG protein
MKGRRMVAAAGAVLLGLAALAWQPGRAQVAEEKATALPADLARVPPGAIAVFVVRPADLWADELGKLVRKHAAKDSDKVVKEFVAAMGVEPAQVERLTMAAVGLRSEPVIVVRTVKPYDKGKVVAATAPGGVEKKHKGLSVHSNDRNRAVCLLDDRDFFFGPAPSVLAFLEKDDVKKEPGVRRALAAAAKGHAAVIGFNPPAFLREVGGELPEEALKPFKGLMETRAAVLTADLGERARVRLRLVFDGPAQAKAADKPLRGLLKLAEGIPARGIKELGKEKGMAPVVDLLRLAEIAIKGAKIEQKDAELLASAEVKVKPAALAFMLAHTMTRVREAAVRAQSANNLKQFALAMHNYHDALGSFPPAAVFDAAGKPLLSWRVQILPYLGQDALYREFRLDEAWDSPHNKKLLKKMPKIFADPRGNRDKAPAFTTHYQAFVGPGAFFEGKRGIRIADIIDGTSNTIMIVEAAQAVPWSKPEDLPYDPKKPLPKLGGILGGGFNAAFCDGSVRFIARTVKESTLRAMITRNGGEIIPRD